MVADRLRTSHPREFSEVHVYSPSQSPSGHSVLKRNKPLPILQTILAAVHSMRHDGEPCSRLPRESAFGGWSLPSMTLQIRTDLFGTA